MFNEKPVNLVIENAQLKTENAALKKKIKDLEAEIAILTEEKDRFEKKYRRLKKEF